MSARFDEIYNEEGWKSIPPERLLRALLLQMLSSVNSERMLMEQLEGSNPSPQPILKSHPPRTPEFPFRIAFARPLSRAPRLRD